MTTPTPEDDVKQLRDALAGEPSPGPWTVELGGGIPVAIATDTFILAQTVGGNDDANAIYIAAANPARIARLLDHIEAQRDLLTRLAAIKAHDPNFSRTKRHSSFLTMNVPATLVEELRAAIASEAKP